MNLPDIDSLWDYNNPAASEQKFLEVFPQASLTLQAELQTQIARTYSLRGLFEQAHQTLDAVDPTIAPRVRIRYCLERGRTFRSAGQPEQARPLFEQAWQLGQQAHEPVLATDAAHMLALVASGEAALNWNRTAIAYAQQHPEAEQRWLGSLLNNLGWSLHSLERYPEALEVFKQAWDFFKTTDKTQQTHIAAWTVGRTLRSLGRFEAALEIQRALEPSDGYVQEELAENLLALGKAEAAKPHFSQAYQRLSQYSWLVKNEPERLARLERLARS